MNEFVFKEKAEVPSSTENVQLRASEKVEIKRERDAKPFAFFQIRPQHTDFIFERVL